MASATNFPSERKQQTGFGRPQTSANVSSTQDAMLPYGPRGIYLNGRPIHPDELLKYPPNTTFGFITFSVRDLDELNDPDTDWTPQPELGFQRNYIEKSGNRVQLVTTQPITQEAIRKADRTAAELIEEEEAIKQKAERKKLKKVRQKERKRLKKQEKEKTNNVIGKQNNEKICNQKSQVKEFSETPPDDSAEDDDEDDDDDEEEEEEEKQDIHLTYNKEKKEKQGNRLDNEKVNKLDDDSSDMNNPKSKSVIEAVRIKTQNENMSRASNHEKTSGATRFASSNDCEEEEEESEEERNELEEAMEALDVNSCFVSKAMANAKRKAEKLKEQKEKLESRKVDSGKSHSKPAAGPHHKDQHQEVPSLQKQAVDQEKNVADLIARSMELAYIGNQHAANGDLNSAVNYFTEAIMHNPSEYKLFGNRAFCFEKMQQYDKALMDSNVALSMNPTWIKGLYRKGRALIGLKKFTEATLVFKEVLHLDSSCTDAAQELIKVQILQLMALGFSKEQSTNAIIIHGCFEKALEALSALRSPYAPFPAPPVENWGHDKGQVTPPKPSALVAPQAPRTPPLQHPKAPPLQHPKALPLHQPSAPLQQTNARPGELFPIWLGGSIPNLSEDFVISLFGQIGDIHSVKVLTEKGCAFVNYFNKDDCDRAIQKFNGHKLAGGIHLQVRFPDRIHPHLGTSKAATTLCKDKLPDECYFWRTTGCMKARCQYRHIPENKFIDRKKYK